MYLSISLQIVKNSNEEGLTFEDGCIGPPSPINGLFDDVSISIGETCLGIQNLIFETIINKVYGL